MEKWEFEMQHNRDLVDCLCLMVDLTPPVHPDGGSAAVPQKAQGIFLGSKFWPEFNKRGHTFGEFASCQCRKPS